MAVAGALALDVQAAEEVRTIPSRDVVFATGDMADDARDVAAVADDLAQRFPGAKLVFIRTSQGTRHGRHHGALTSSAHPISRERQGQT